MTLEPERVVFTDEARVLLRSLMDEHGLLMFHQSGGCCDGSAPMCFVKGEFRVGSQDVLLGVVEGCEFFMGGAQFERWAHTQLVIDVVKGRGAGFSLEAPRGVRFLTRSRMWGEDELCALPNPPRGPSTVE